MSPLGPPRPGDSAPLVPTAGQTIGPFFGFALPYAGGPDLVAPDHPEAIVVRGRVLDGAGEPVPDALVELSQADSEARLARATGSLTRDGDFTGWGRCATDTEGRFAFTTVRCGAPFLALAVFARGLLDRLFTRIYLPEHAGDAFLLGLPAERRHTLVATEEPGGVLFDVRLQGEDETVFLVHRRD